MCPVCNHKLEYHNDAGSAPVGPLPEWSSMPAFIGEGRMCCYAKPNEGQTGVANWGGRVCGCNHVAIGMKRYHY